MLPQRCSTDGQAYTASPVEDSASPKLFSFAQTRHFYLVLIDLPKELRLEVYSYLSAPTFEPIDGLTPRRFGYWSII